MRPINFLETTLTSSTSNQKQEITRTPVEQRLAVNQLTTLHWTLSEALCGYREQAIPGIGVALSRMKTRGLERAIEEVVGSGLRVSTLGWVGGFTGLNGYSWKEAVRDARFAIWVAGQIGAEAVNVMTGPRRLHIPKHARRIVIEALKELAPVAAENKVRLAVQPMHPVFARSWTFLHTLDDALAMIREIDDPHVGLGFGPYHLADESGLMQRLPELVPLIATVQLSDWHRPPQNDQDRVLPGDGCLPLSKIISTLEESGYQGMYEIDAWGRDLWNRDHHDLISDCRRRYEDLCRR
ncbi:MAG: sugar phosphate isomerase/epimerase family protein [Planctomycetaceae bacterium]